MASTKAKTALCLSPNPEADGDNALRCPRADPSARARSPVTEFGLNGRQFSMGAAQNIAFLIIRKHPEFRGTA